MTTVFETLFRLPLWEAAYAAQKLAVYVTSSNERKLGQWENTWRGRRTVGRERRGPAEYNRYLADGIIRNLAASKSRDASAHSIGLVGEASVWSILLFGNDRDGKGFDRVLNGMRGLSAVVERLPERFKTAAQWTWRPFGFSKSLMLPRRNRRL